MTGQVRLARVYGWAPEPGPAFFVERLWPRGIRKDDLAGVTWIRDIAPSTELRRWYGHDRSRWEEFRRRYRHELDADPKRAETLLSTLRNTDVTLLYASREAEHNSATMLREWLLDAVQGRGG